MSTWCKWCGRNQYCRKCVFVDEPSPTITLEVVVRGDRPHTARATIAWLTTYGWTISESSVDADVLTKRVGDSFLNL